MNLWKQQIAPSGVNDRYAFAVGSSISPQTLTSIFNQADIGYLYQYADLLEECRQRDLHLQSVLAKREAAVSGADWEIRPPPKSGKRGEAIATWCKQRLIEIVAEEDLDLSFSDALDHLMGGIYHGRSGVEAVYRQEGKWWLPDRLCFMHPRRFAYTTSWRLHIWDAQGSQTDIYGRNNSSPFSKFPGVPVASFPKGKFLVHRPRIYGTYPTREGLGRGTVLYSMFKRFGVRDWLAFAEWAGRGLRLGSFKSGTDTPDEAKASPDDVDVLKQALENLSSAIAVTYPDTTKIDIKDAPDNHDTHDQLITMVNLEISKGVLGETLTTEVGRTGGNRALGDVHQSESAKLSIKDSKALSATLYRDLLRPLVWMNFGENAPVPTIEFGVSPKEDKDSFTDRVIKLVGIGLRVGQNAVRDVVGIPDPQEGEELLGGMSQDDDTEDKEEPQEPSSVNESEVEDDPQTERTPKLDPESSA